MRVIVHDFGVDVNGYAQFGRCPPLFKPAQCPACGASDSLESHGVRSRAAWRAVGKQVRRDRIYVRRLCCKACDDTFTVLPSCLLPLRRYCLEVVEQVVRLRFLERLSFRAMERRLAHPAASTHRDWVQAFGMAARAWLTGLAGWLSRHRPVMTLTRPVESDAAAGLLAMGVQCLDWLCQHNPGRHPARRGLLEGLWLWGASRMKRSLLFPTRCRAGPQRGRCQSPVRPGNGPQKGR